MGKFIEVLMQNIFEKKNIVFLTLELVGNDIYSLSVVIEHQTRPLKEVEIHVFKVEGNSEILRGPLKVMVGDEDLFSVADARLRYTSLCSGRKDKHPYMFLVLG